MEKILLLSVLVMMVAIPLHASKFRDHKKALRRSLARFFAFNLVYWVAVVFIWFGLLNGKDPRRLLHGATDSQGQGQSR